MFSTLLIVAGVAGGRRMIDIRKSSNPNDPASLSHRMRKKRFTLFEEITGLLPRPLRIVDVGGTNLFWEQCGWAGREGIHITIVNLVPERRIHDNVVPKLGDATKLAEFPDGSFNVAFSNSVIEHLFTYEKQAAMAREIRRVANAYWVQTPNFWFPIEPHFHLPGWQWMPESLRVAIIRRQRCGWRGPCPDLDEARRTVREVRLLTRRELVKLFPGATVIRERFAGLVKSWILLGGFGRPGASGVL